MRARYNLLRVASIPSRDRFADTWNALSPAKQSQVEQLVLNPRAAPDPETAAIVVGFCRFMRWRLSEGPPIFARKYVAWTDLPRYKKAEDLNLPVAESDDASAG